MIYSIKDILNSCNSVSVNINGKWVPARPVCGPFVTRIKAAWLVLAGKADAVKWPEDQ